MNSLIETESRGLPADRRRSMRTAGLGAATLLLLSVAALAMLVTAVITLFRRRRLYCEAIAASTARAILRMWGVRFRVHQTEPFPESQTIYISNHTSTLDVFILIALMLPNTRFFMWGGTRKWVPMAVMGHLTGTFYTPSQTNRANRVKCFQRAERVLRRTGESVYLSPEGRRVTDGTIGPFNKGAFHLATNLKAPIVPLYIDTPQEINPGLGFSALPGIINVYRRPSIPTCEWKLDELEMNKNRVRQLYVQFERELREKKQ
ncbi:MAG TPA: lysophospholipid acyltransferase family protein [Candidatus Binatia bacterium]|nr:lysophospholipid acyltransferase family protein [Candidatus Binatia bacterium]